MKITLSLIVLRAKDIEKSLVFYQALGLEFIQEQHGKGPVHYSSIVGETVIELYSVTTLHPAYNLRLGFSVESLDDTVKKLKNIDAPMELLINEQGPFALVRDPDFRTIELLEK